MPTSISIINLESLLDLSARLNETLDEEYILNLSTLSIMGKLKIIRSCVLAPDDGDGYKVILTKGKSEAACLPFIEFSSFTHLEPINESYKALIEAGYDYCLPVFYHNKIQAIIYLGKRPSSEDLTEEEIYYANLVANITANAIQNARNQISLIREKVTVDQRNQLLATLFEISRDFSTLLSKEQILRLLSLHLMGQLMVSRFAVCHAGDGDAIEIIVNRFRQQPSEQLLQKFIGIGSMLQVTSIELETIDRQALDRLEAGLVSPMIIQGKTKGLLIVGKKKDGSEFTNENIQFIESLGNLALLALENERLFRQELEKKRLEAELSLALEIQKKLLPARIPRIEGIELCGTSIPSRHVGGDYYDFFELPGGDLLIAIADVSGKGMPAALLMANVQAALRAMAPLTDSIELLVDRLNRIIYFNTGDDKFVTMFIARLELATRRISYINSGHNPPVLCRADGTVELLDTTGLILGIMENYMSASAGNIVLRKGDILCLYTDGVTEAKNQEGSEFEVQRLTEIIESHSSKPAESIQSKIIEEVTRYSAEEHQYDDITLVVLKAL